MLLHLTNVISATDLITTAKAMNCRGNMKKSPKEEKEADLALADTLDFILDQWQNDVLNTKGNICMRSGRQVGKSTIIAMKAGLYALNNWNKTILVISAVERQAELLFEKILGFIHGRAKSKIMKGKDRPTKHKLQLTNGSIIHCLPTGESGYGIRGFTVNLLIADEAAFIPEAVWTAVTPMLATTKGNIILLSTPHGREGYFARCFKDDTYSKFHISSEDCQRIDKVFLQHEKATMTKREYAQEYLGEFVDDLMQLFPDSLISACQLLKRPSSILPDKDYYLGVDVARMGGDESTFQILQRLQNNKLEQVESIAKSKTLTTQTTEEIISLNKIYNFRKIYIDDGGIGAAVFDSLLRNEETKRKVVPINNAARSLTRDDKKRKRLMKEDLYNNLLSLMEHSEIKILDDAEIFQSLKSVQYEYDEAGKMRIFGRYTHIAEGLIRAAWCVKEKHLNFRIEFV